MNLFRNLKMLLKSTTLAAGVASALVSVDTWAADQSSGCGLGWQVTSKNSLLSSSIRSTTNAVLPNSFSMTFGTSGCTKHSIVQLEREQEYFVNVNFEHLNVDLAQGSGEYLASFAVVMGCGKMTSHFGQVMQSQYGKLVRDLDSNAATFLKRVRQTVKDDASLNASCGFLS